VSALSFGHPLALLLAVVAGLLGIWALSRERRHRRQALAAFGEEDLFAPTSSLPSTRARLTGRVLQLAAILLALVALARPQFGERPASLPHTGRDVLVLLDLSRSMNAADSCSSRSPETMTRSSDFWPLQQQTIWVTPPPTSPVR
jgi:Ca-activated chloride channel family protein